MNSVTPNENERNNNTRDEHKMISEHNNNENEKKAKRETQFELTLSSINGNLKLITKQYESRKKNYYDPIFDEYNNLLESMRSSAISKNYENKNFKINTLKAYISSEYKIGLDKIDKYNTITLSLKDFKKRVLLLNNDLMKEREKYRNISQANINNFKNSASFNSARYETSFTQVEEKLNSINVDQLIVDLTTPLKSYLTQLRINISTNIIEVYNKTAIEKISAIDTTIAEMNANNVNSKKSLDIILRANTGVVAQILLLKGILNSVKSAISNTSSNTKNTYSNSAQIQTAINTAITTLVQTYKNMESEKVKSIQNTYTSTVKGDIYKLDGELKTKKDELKTVLSTLSNSSLGNRYPSKEILLELSSQIDGLLITTTEKNILDKLAKVIKEINDRLSVSDNGTLGNNNLRTTGNAIPMNATGNGDSSVEIDPNGALNMNRKSPKNPILNKPVLQNKIKEILNRKNKITGRSTRTSRELRELSSSNPEIQEWKKKIKNIVNAKDVLPSNPNYNNSRYLENYLTKNNGTGSTRNNIKKVVNSIPVTAEVESNETFNMSQLPRPRNNSVSSSLDRSVVSENAKNKGSASETRSVPPLVRSENENEYQRALATNNLELVARAIGKFPTSQVKYTPNQRKRFNALAAHQRNVINKK
jgi:hypothetical protein